MQLTINHTILSVNQAWQGKRFKTALYNKYEKDILYMLPKCELPAAPYKVEIVYAFSNKVSDIDNPTKMILDILQKKYNFNDKEIYELNLKKTIVKTKQQEYIIIKINTITNN